MRYLLRLYRLPLYVWYARHEFIHLLLGLVYAWFLREIWNELNIGYVIIAMVGSVVIDADHLLFYLLYGRNDPMAIEARKLLKAGQIRNLFVYVKDAHKHNTSLLTHNIYFIGAFFLMSFASWWIDWKIGVILFGSIVIHLLFDILDDLWVLGYVNDNWKRWKRKKTS